MQRVGRRRRVSVLAAACAAGVIMMMFATSGVAGAVASAGTTSDDEATATLSIIEPNVTVKRAGKENFKPGREGQRLRVGDTVQTDAAGFAQVNYTDDSFTRLDVNTTFTIVSLTDDEGNRKIKGSVESGQTWNRTSALTESESFEQEGAGATAAVTGTAFAVSCTTPTSCTFTSVVDGITLTTIDGELQHLDPLQECDSDEVEVDVNADLCGAPARVTLDAILANQWLLQNLFIDGISGFEGIVVVGDGAVVSVTTTPPSNITPTPPEGTPPPPAPKVDEDGPIDIVSPTPVPDTGEITTDEATIVSFTFNVTDATYIKFTAKPETQLGRIWVGAQPVGPPYNCSTACINLGTEYSPTEMFWFVPDAVDSPGPSTGSFEFVSGNAGGISDPVTVQITVTDIDICSEVETDC